MTRQKTFVCYMIYSDAEGQKNRKFIEMFRRAGERQGLLFSFVSYQTYQQMPLPDMVLNRTRDPQVSRWYEKRQVKVCHDSDIVTIGNDKYKTLQRLRERLSAMDSSAQKLRIRQEETISSAWCPKSFQVVAQQTLDLAWMHRQIKTIMGEIDTVVLKSVDGHGGNEVFRLSADPEHAIQEWKQTLVQLQGRRLLCQEWIDCAAQDLRIYILWGEIYAAVLRQGQGDFRSNYSRGGSVRPYTLSAEEKSQIQPFIQALGGNRLAMAGMDFFVRRDGMLVFNELEEMVGSRMLYECTDLDIVQDFVYGLGSLR